MTEQDLIQLVASYSEWRYDTNVGIGHDPEYVYCPICFGGGYFSKIKKRPPQHKKDCLRLKYNNDKNQPK